MSRAGVVEQRRRQGPSAPVGALLALVEAHPEGLLQQVAQPGAGLTQGAGGHAGVEERRDVEAEVAPQADQIVFGGVEDFLDRWVGQQGPEGIHAAERQRVDQVVGIGRRDLNQANPFTVGVQAVGFGVDRQPGVSTEIADKAAQVIVGGDDHRRREVEGMAELYGVR